MGAYKFQSSKRYWARSSFLWHAFILYEGAGKDMDFKNKVIPHNWIQLASIVLDHGSQLQWNSYWREESKALRYQKRVIGFFFSVLPK